MTAVDQDVANKPDAFSFRNPVASLTHARTALLIL